MGNIVDGEQEGVAVGGLFWSLLVGHHRFEADINEKKLLSD
jgi:hypothetical protein